MADEKKFLDKAGVQYLWSKLSLEDYPNNETLIAVLNAIDETKADKNELFSGSWNDLTDRPFGENKVILIEWDGDFSKITDTIVVDEYTTWYRINDNYLSNAEINTLLETHELNVEYIPGNYNDSLYGNISFKAAEDVEYIEYQNFIPAVGHGFQYIYNIPEDNFTSTHFRINNITFPKKGTWVERSGAGDGIISKVSLTSLNTLDDKFLSENVAMLEDIPEVPIQSVNGMTGDVIISFDNYYNKTEVDAFHGTLEDYVDNQVSALVNAAPETLDTLGELATAFEENKEVVEALDASITNKQDKISDTLILVDTVTGLQHKIQIQNGQLVSFPVE